MLLRRYERHAVLAAAMLAALTMLASGLAAGDLLRFALFHVLWVLGPGLVLAAVLLPARRRPLERLTLAWGLGYPLEMGVFAATAAAGARWAFWLWPVIAALAGVATHRRRRREPRTPADVPAGRLPRGAGLAAAAVALVLVVHLAAFSSEETPLTPTGATVTYFQDYLWNLGYAAEARHRWPLLDPQVSGEPRPYHLGWALDAAAADQITGAGLEAVVSRLQPLPWLLALVCGFLALGTGAFGSAWAGVVGLVLFLYAGDALVGAFADARPGYRSVLTNASLSPSFLLGLALWLPALLLVARGVRGRGEWLALALVLAGCAAAKGAILPLLVGAVGVVTARRLLRRQPADASLLGAAAVGLVILVASLLTIFAGAESVLKLEPPGHLWERGSRGWVPAAAASLAALMLPALIGLSWARPRRLFEFTVALLVVGAGSVAALATAATDEIYFLQYALVPACILSGLGLMRLFSERPAIRGWRAVAVLALAVATVAGVVGGADAVRLAQVAVIAVAAGAACRRLPAAPVAVAATLAVVATAHTMPVPYHGLRAAKRAAASLGLPVEPPGRFSYHVLRPGTADVVHTSRTPVEPAVVEALHWIRDHTAPTAVVMGPGRRYGVRTQNSFEYAAFSERASFLGGTLFSIAAARAGYLGVYDVGGAVHLDRERLQDAVYYRCDPAALRTVVRRHEVSHVLVDRSRGNHHPACLARLGTTVFENRWARVIAVR